MSQELIRASARGGGITVAGSVATIGIQVVSLVVLSRLLTPEDFGLVAMVSVFVAFAYLIKDFGLPVATLQAPSLTHQQASNMFWLNAGIAAASAGALTLATPLLVSLFSEPRLAAIVPAMALVILASGIGAQIQVDLARRMRYTALVGSDIAAQVTALALAIVLAAAGFDYWALVAQAIATAVIALVLRWAISGWKPRRFRREHGTARLFRTGTEYGLALLLTFVQNNVDTLIVGATLGPTQLGYYNRAYQILAAPAGRLLDPLSQVVVPTLNKARSEGRDDQQLLLRIQFAVGCAMIGVLSLVGGTAPLLVPIVLGTGWEESIPVLQILAIGACFVVLSTVSYWSFIINGKSRELLHYNLISKPFAVLCIVIGSSFGLVGVAVGYAVAMAASWPLNLWWLARAADLRAREFARNGFTLIVAGAFGGCAAFAIIATLGESSVVLGLITAIVTGAALILLALAALPHGRAQLRGTTKLLGAIVTSRRSA